MRSRSYSRSKRSCTISMCSIPKKPQRKPKPKASELSGSKNKAESLICNFCNASRNGSKSLASIGKRPAYTCGLTFLKPGKVATSGVEARVIVSPTGAPKISLIPAITKPTSPASRISVSVCLGLNTPTEVTG